MINNKLNMLLTLLVYKNNDKCGTDDLLLKSTALKLFNTIYEYVTVQKLVHFLYTLMQFYF